jgi:hypothetical protein
MAFEKFYNARSKNVRAYFQNFLVGTKKHATGKY